MKESCTHIPLAGYNRIYMCQSTWCVIKHRPGLRVLLHLPVSHSVAAQGVKWSSLSFIHYFSRQKNFEMAWTSPFQDFWAYGKLWGHFYLTCTCYWADSLPLVAISAVFLLSSPLCQPFYLRPWVTPTIFMPRVRVRVDLRWRVSKLNFALNGKRPFPVWKQQVARLEKQLSDWKCSM